MWSSTPAGLGRPARWASVAGVAGLVCLLCALAYGATRFEFSANSRVRPHHTTFLALGYRRFTALEAMSLHAAHPLGVAVRLIGKAAHDPSISISGLYRAPDGALWLTVTTGPRLAYPGAHGCPAGGCPTKPNSCAGAIVRIGPRSHTSETSLQADSSVLLSDGTPNRTGQELAYVQQACGNYWFNRYVVVRDLRSGREWRIGEHAACHLRVGQPSWNAAGSKILFTYTPPGRLAKRHGGGQPGTCEGSSPSEIAIVPAHQDQSLIPARDLTRAPKGCGYDSARYDGASIIAIKVCGPLDPDRDQAYLVQMDAQRRVVRQVPLAARPDGTFLSVSRTGEILISEYQAPKYSRPRPGHPPRTLVGPQSDIWTYTNHQLRPIHTFKQHGYLIEASW